MTETVREAKRADELKSGDWLAREQIEGNDDQPVEVIDIHPFADAIGPGVLLVYRTLAGLPRSISSDAATTYELATEAEVRESKDYVRREQVATQLRQLAELIVSKQLPLTDPYQRAHVRFHFGRDVEQLDRVAELLGIEREIAYGTASVQLPPAGEGLLDVSWEAYPPKEPKPEAAPVPDADPTGLLYTRAADDPTPVSPARTPLQTGAVVDGGQLIDDVECYVPNGFQAPEVIAERTAACQARHPGRDCAAPATP